MSHFIALVVLPHDTPEDSIDVVVAGMLAPYDEARHVPKYQTKCACVGIQAQIEVENVVSEEFDLEAIRQEYQGLPEDQQTDDKWREMITPRMTKRQEMMAGHPLKEKPNPQCTRCLGTGTCWTTYNPHSKWDTWRVGGRWDGWIFGPERERQCRDKKGGFNYDREHERPENNCRLVSEIPIDDPHYVPFAVVTPDGEWHQQGRMGWWAVVTDGMGEKEWHEQVKAILAKYPDQLAVAIDCHI